MKYKVLATYTVRKEMCIEVPDGLDPKSPANWGEIEYEHDLDCNLYDVESAEEDDNL
jgi:hypothetical protein